MPEIPYCLLNPGQTWDVLTTSNFNPCISNTEKLFHVALLPLAFEHPGICIWPYKLRKCY